MKKLTILCDADETIEDLLPYWLEELNNKYGFSVKKEDIKSWNVRAAYPTLTQQQVDEPVFNDELWSKITPIKDSSRYLQKLIEDGHDVYIVTAANYQSIRAKVNKLLELFPFFDYKKIISTWNKQLIKGDILIDDGIHNLVGGDYIKFLYDQPHNQYINEENYGITRVKSWVEIYERICEIANK